MTEDKAKLTGPVGKATGVSLGRDPATGRDGWLWIATMNGQTVQHLTHDPELKPTVRPINSSVAMGVELVNDTGEVLAQSVLWTGPDTGSPESPPDLAAWLLEQLAEDESENSAAGEPEAWCDRSAGTHYEWERIAAEVDAKRRIVALHEMYRPYAPKEPGGYLPAVCLFCTGDREEDQLMPCEHLKLLALPYADRPGYRQEWRP